MEKVRRPNTRLRDYRYQRGWTQADVAEKINASEVEVGRWERGDATPQPHWASKLCLLFGATAEELGLVNMAEKMKTSEGREHFENSPGPIPPKSEASSLASASSAFAEAVPLPKKRRQAWLPIVGGIFLLLIIASLLSVTLAPWKWFAHTSPSPRSPVSTPEESTLYQADWSKGADAWPFPGNWHWSGADGGTMESDASTANQVILAPFSPPSTDYTVEVQIKRLGYATFGGKAYGVVVRDTNTAGYVCGTGIHTLPEHFFLSKIVKVTSYYALSDLADVPAHLDNGWHLYRIEVRATTMAFYLDNHLIQQVNNVAEQGGEIGIYVDHASIALKSFSVSAL